MDPQAVIDYLHTSLRMKICKRLLMQISDKELLLEYTDQDTISIILQLSDSSFSTTDLVSDVPEEGLISLPHQIIRPLTSAMIIDVLIVDDIEFNISVLRRMLEGLLSYCKCNNAHRKFTVHNAGSGIEALELISAQDRLGGGYRLVIMDCLMPQLDGWETCIAIKKLYEERKIKILPYVLAYSAFDSREDIVKSENSGMCGHISKPCTQRDLCNMVSQWVNRALNVEFN